MLVQSYFNLSPVYLQFAPYESLCSRPLVLWKLQDSASHLHGVAETAGNVGIDLIHVVVWDLVCNYVDVGMQRGRNVVKLFLETYMRGGIWATFNSSFFKNIEHLNLNWFIINQFQDY